MTTTLNKMIIGPTDLYADVSLAPVGGVAWTMTVNGGVRGTLLLDAGNPGLSTITIGSTGFVQDDTFGINLRSGAIINNRGLIAGSTGIIIVGVEGHTITNTGTITASATDAIFAFNESAEIVTNLGLINGNVDLNTGDDHLVNSGRIFGNVFLGGGDDTFKVSGRGIVTGLIDLGGGADKFFGGAASETLTGGEGNDTVNLGGGNDTFKVEVGGGGNDTVNGGSGIDTYDASDCGIGLTINFDKIVHFGQPPSSASVNGSTDTLSGFENATGSIGGDYIIGSGAGNFLDGGGGVDVLYGLGGNDSLYGGDDSTADILTGGLGRDTLVGGSNTDRFDFNTLAESGKTPTTCDVIENFNQAEADQIRLLEIDANTKHDGNDDFRFRGMDGTFEQAGDLRVRWIPNGVPGGHDTLVEADVNGDKKADFAIRLKGEYTLVAGDFFL